MPLTEKTDEEVSDYETQLLNGVPNDGTSIGNKRLREDILDWDTNLYFAIRKRLLDLGIIVTGRGKGGSIRRLVEDTVIPVPADDVLNEHEAVPNPFPDEQSLYVPMADAIRNYWVQDQPFDQVIVEHTDRGGGRRDGIWARPDVTVAASTTFTYVPGRHLDIITFEIKHYDGLNVTAVYEALAHRRAATRSYVLVYIPDEAIEAYENPVLLDIADEASKHEIGLIVATNPNDFDTWDIREEAGRVEPDPARMNTFIRNQLREATRDQIVRWFR